MSERRPDIDRIEQYFETDARRFDALYGETSGFLVRGTNTLLRKGLFERFRMSLQWMGSLKGKTVVDFGCGSGRLSVAAALAGARSVVGLDLAGGMIDMAERLARERSVDRICQFRREDFFQFHPAEEFDFSVALGVFDYVKSPEHLIGKMADVTRGSLIASFPGRSLVRGNFRKFRYFIRNCPLYLYSVDSIQSAYAAAGFREPEILPYPSRGFLVRARKENRLPS